MKYISDDGKIFSTEQECCRYEKEQERIANEEKIRKDKLESERQKRFEEICQSVRN